MIKCYKLISNKNCEDILLYNLLPKLKITLTSAETKRLIIEKCISIDNQKITDVSFIITSEMLQNGFNLTIGKREYRIQL